MKKWLFMIIAAGFVVSGFLLKPKIQHRLALKETEAVQQNLKIPVPVAFSFSVTSSVLAMKDAVNYDVPFTSQTPLLVWDELHKEACEEASILMVLRYFSGENIGSPEQADADIIRLVIANAELGFAVDDTAEQAAELLRSQDSSLTVELLYDPTVDSLKALLASGKLIIAPLQGQFLGNPYYTAPGPRYHMLVVKGYTKDGYFITNDPGTKRGKDYVYTFDVLMNAIHDWNGGDVENGKKVVIVVGGA